MTKHVCIHAHFYQPPRDNPWLEMVELQESAHPYHDWNERIAAECYGPNAASRILGPDGRIFGIMNNYSRVSFNFGPTLLAWMEQADAEVYAKILEGDRLSRELYSGHGSAIAQAYNHPILPLANSRDKRTQILWGIKDFEFRFGRYPEGMWLPETAVDLETLDLLAQFDIRFTILSPRQASKVRPLGDHKWEDVSGERIDTKQPYLCQLPSGRKIAIFFYNGAIAQQLAFEGLLHNGEEVAKRILSSGAEGDQDQLLHVATDGETYGHHHWKGEMALTYCLYHIDSHHLAKVTIYGEYLDHHPPTHEVEIFENSSWSCVHGVERWRDNCGCHSGLNGDWHQRWRKPLREALDWLRDRLAEQYQNHAGAFFHDPWAARDDYIQVLLDRTPQNTETLLSSHSKRPLSPTDRVNALKLLEMQRHAMLMYTSCGWFFDEISGIESTQILKYASRAIQLLNEVTGLDLESKFTELLASAPSNLNEHQNGKMIYEKFIQPAQVGIKRVGAHFAISSLFSSTIAEDSIRGYRISDMHAERLQAGKVQLAIGRLTVHSTLFSEQSDLFYAVLHLGDHNVSGGVQDLASGVAYLKIAAELKHHFERGDIPETLKRLGESFDNQLYSLRHLFRDQQQQIMGQMLFKTEDAIETFYRQIYQDNYNLFHSIMEMSTPMPDVFKATIDFVINRELYNCLNQEPFDKDQFRHLKNEIDRWGTAVDKESLCLLGTRQAERLVDQLEETPLDYQLLDELAEILEKYSQLEISLNLWRCQNTLYEIGVQQFFIRSKLAEQGHNAAARWVERFKQVANLLEVRFEG